MAKKENDMTSPEMRRIGTVHRDRYIDHLSDMMAAGYLSLGEFEERKNAALAAVVAQDLWRLTDDLPSVPKPKTVTVTYNVAGRRFSPWRWGTAITAGVTAIAAPGPILGGIYHGAGHAPGNGFLVVVIIAIGVALLVAGGISQAPDKEKEIPA